MFQVHCRKRGKVPEERQVTLETAKDNSSLCYLPASLTKYSLMPCTVCSPFSPESIDRISYCVLRLLGVARDLNDPINGPLSDIDPPYHPKAFILYTLLLSGILGQPKASPSVFPLPPQGFIYFCRDCVPSLLASTIQVPVSKSVCALLQTELCSHRASSGWLQYHQHAGFLRCLCKCLMDSNVT